MEKESKIQKKKNSQFDIQSGIYFKSIINSLKPNMAIATIVHAGGNQLLFRL